MITSVYLVTGDSLPPKLVVVALNLECDVLLNIENRFQQGAKYTTVTPVNGGVFALELRYLGQYDQAYFPGYDNSSMVTEGGADFVPADAEPGRIVSLDAAPEGSRRAYLVNRTVGETTEMMLVVLAHSEGIGAESIIQALAMKPGAASISATYVGSGSFQLKSEIAQFGFSVCTGPAIVV
jgi:hypothetical protein